MCMCCNTIIVDHWINQSIGFLNLKLKVVQPCQNEIRQPCNNIVTRLYILITWLSKSVYSFIYNVLARL